jgi:hypothetical protein
MLMFGMGMGVVFVPLTTVSLAGVRPQDSGAASSMVNVMQQVGGSLGLAVLVAAFGTATRNAASSPLTSLPTAVQHRVLAHGMSDAFALAAIFDAVALLIVAAVVRTRRAAVPAAPPAAVRPDRTPVRVPDVD